VRTDADGEAGAAGAAGARGGGVGGGVGGGGVQIVDTVSQEQLLREQAARRPASTSEEGALTVDKEVYYVGVIDILCEYGFQKQLEHSYKAAKYGERVGAQNFSVVDPVQYSARFQNFLADGIA